MIISDHHIEQGSGQRMTVANALRKPCDSRATASRLPATCSSRALTPLFISTCALSRPISGDKLGDFTAMGDNVRAKGCKSQLRDREDHNISHIRLIPSTTKNDVSHHDTTLKQSLSPGTTSVYAKNTMPRCGLHLQTVLLDILHQTSLTPLSIISAATKLNMKLCINLWYPFVLTLLILLGVGPRGCSSASAGDSTAAASGYCQVYSYNIKYRTSGVGEKHLFVCCNNNAKERQCEGATYQKPSRAEAFCTGEVIESSGGSHWTQMESSSFPEAGHFYCGGCCGQHLAWESCTDQYTRAKKNSCLNWVQCYQRECRKITKEILDKHPLKCTLPPPPHPKHYIYVPPKLPANISASFRPSRDPLHPSPSPASASSGGGGQNGTDFSTAKYECTKQECEAVDIQKRCSTRCCVQYCCLPDGPLPYPRGDRLILGMSVVQVVGLAIGILLLVVLVILGTLMAVKRLVPGCKNFHFPTTSRRGGDHQAQILVIEGPEDAEEDTDDEEDENHEIESA